MLSITDVLSRLAAFSEAVSPSLLGAKCLGKANALSDAHLTHGWAKSILLILVPSHRIGLGMTILSSSRQRDRKGILLLENTFFPPPYIETQWEIPVRESLTFLGM